MLICNKCEKEIKTLSDYVKKGLCRTCYNAYMRNYYAKNFKSDIVIKVHERSESDNITKKNKNQYWGFRHGTEVVA